MRKHNTPPGPSARHDAMDVNDFVYAATGARVRRLTMPDGEHWFPTVDVCTELGHTNPRKALADHVQAGGKSTLENVTSRYGLSIPAGREWRRDLHLVNLQGLIQLVNGCTKPACLPFKQWVSRVIATVQREGSYALEVSEISRPTPPSELMDAIVRLEMRTERFHTEVLDSLHRSEQAWSQILDALGCRPGAEPEPDKRELRLRTENLFAQWKDRLSITEDVWAVAVYILPTLAEAGQVGHSPETLAARTGLTRQRVHDCLRFLQKHRCIRQNGLTDSGNPVYVAELPPA
ncbi:Bro-N domain-containing protein [Streptomyces sp. 110]|uniref:Bro-N domain-containing protein n=2 Tax=Streptomyces endocoffeicus TaxID=2898945 RepID=A0ABS1Q219_9ACTN|nr:Bro-N domain-containing protein [Streptomyces endocoffeicus]